MDEIARRYLLLGLRLARHVPGAFGFYVGPPELAEAIAGEDPAPPAELHAEALNLADLVAERPQETPAGRRRVAWLSGQLTALSALARRAAGEEIGFIDMTEELFGIGVSLEPDSTFEAARRMIEAALPGRGSLRTRLDRHQATVVVPSERVLAAVSSMTSVMRAQSRAQLWLPERESVDFAEAHGVPWEAEARYRGSGRSTVRINLDLPVSLWLVVELAAHECYPGHHAEAAAKDTLLVATGHAELTLPLALSPQAVVSEGMGSLAREVVMTDGELAFELHEQARSWGLKVDIEAELVVQRARRLLLPALGNAAVALHRDGQPPDQVRTYLHDIGLIDDDRLDAMARLSDPLWAGYAFACSEGRRLVSEWLEVEGQTRGYERLLAEQLTPSLLLADLGEPPALYPDSFA